jgi:hypothetical protein
MPGSISFNIRQERWTGKETDPILSREELIDRYLFGIDICTDNGIALSDSAFNQKIVSAQRRIENFLSVKLWKQAYFENRDFVFQEWQQWAFTQTTYPIRDMISLVGFYGKVEQVIYPAEWSSIQTTKSDREVWRSLHLVPTASSGIYTTGASLVALGITPHLNFFGLSQVPNYWKLTYCTGFDNIPPEIADVVGKWATIEIMAILGDIVLGPGIAAQQISYDGLMESIQTTQSAENSAYSARIRQYLRTLRDELKQLQDFYKGMTFTAI